MRTMEDIEQSKFAWLTGGATTVFIFQAVQLKSA